MEKIVKARKIYKCVFCNGNIQKGEKHIHEKLKVPNYNDEINPDLQTGIWYESFRRHNKNCFPRLLHFCHSKEILKNCNFGIHEPGYDGDPDSYDDNEYCKWCGEKLN